MKKLRALLVLLLCLALPWSAVASGMQNMLCRHHGMPHQHAAAASTMSMHQHHADRGCDHGQKCECQHHCAGNAVAAFLPVGAHLPALAGSGFEADHNSGLTTAAWASFPFRPPIAATAGAA